MTETVLVSQKKSGTLDSSRVVVPRASVCSFLLSKQEEERTFSEIVQTDVPQKVHFRMLIPSGAVFSVDDFLKTLTSFKPKFSSGKVLVFSYSTKDNHATVYDFVIISYYVKNSIEMMTLAQNFNDKYSKKFEPGLSLDIYGIDSSILIYGNSDPEFSEGKKILITKTSFNEEEILYRSLLTSIEGCESFKVTVDEIVHVTPYVDVPPPSQPKISPPAPEAVHKNDNAVVEVIASPEPEVPECKCEVDAQEEQGDMIPAGKVKKSKKNKKKKKKSKKRGFLMTLLFGPKKSKKEKKKEKKEKKDKKFS